MYFQHWQQEVNHFSSEWRGRSTSLRKEEKVATRKQGSKECMDLRDVRSQKACVFVVCFWNWLQNTHCNRAPTATPNMISKLQRKQNESYFSVCTMVSSHCLSLFLVPNNSVSWILPGALTDLYTRKKAYHDSGNTAERHSAWWNTATKEESFFTRGLRREKRNPSLSFWWMSLSLIGAWEMSEQPWNIGISVLLCCGWQQLKNEEKVFWKAFWILESACSFILLIFQNK